MQKRNMNNKLIIKKMKNNKKLIKKQIKKILNGHIQIQILIKFIKILEQ